MGLSNWSSRVWREVHREKTRAWNRGAQDRLRVLNRVMPRRDMEAVNVHTLQNSAHFGELVGKILQGKVRYVR